MNTISFFFRNYDIFMLRSKLRKIHETLNKSRLMFRKNIILFLSKKHARVYSAEICTVRMLA